MLPCYATNLVTSVISLARKELRFAGKTKLIVYQVKKIRLTTSVVTNLNFLGMMEQ